MVQSWDWPTGFQVTKRQADPCRMVTYGRVESGQGIPRSADNVSGGGTSTWSVNDAGKNKK